MKLNRFWFGFLLGICPFIIYASFQYAYLERGYQAYGGEVFTIILPVLIIAWRVWTVNKIKEELKLRRKRPYQM